MPKMRTHKGTAKRITITKGGKKGGKQMRQSRPSGAKTKARTSTKRDNRRRVEVSNQDQRIIKRLLPGI